MRIPLIWIIVFWIIICLKVGYVGMSVIQIHRMMLAEEVAYIESNQVILLSKVLDAK